MNSIETQRVSIIVTKKCTLKCKLCGALAPYVKNYHPTLDFLKSEVDAFFRLALRTGIIDISGGEPFLRGTDKDFALGELLTYLSNNYAGRFERMRIFTNGTVVPSDALCEVFRSIGAKMRFSITIDNYGKHSPEVGEVAGKLRHFGIITDIRDYTDVIHCGGWVDLRNISKKHDRAAAQELYEKCAIPQKLGCCLELLDGMMSPCSVAAARYLCGEADKDSEDIIDLFGDLTEMRSKLHKMLTAQQFVSCQFCDGGLAEDSPRFVPAEQANSDEIEIFRTKYTMRI